MQERSQRRPGAARVSRLRPSRRQLRLLAGYLGCFLVAALIALPVNIERSVEGVHFSDDLGTFPVEVSMSHNGMSTLDTGIFGRVYWKQTGALGFGIYARSTGPPEAGGTLASYVNPEFIQANAALIKDPNRVVHAYAEAMVRSFRNQLIRDELVVGLVGGALLFVVLPRRRMAHSPRAPLVAVSAVLVIVATALSAVVAVELFRAWPGSTPPSVTYGIPGVKKLSFGSPQVREVAEQVQPFIKKNSTRIDERADHYQAVASATFAEELKGRHDLAPRAGETMVLAEADPQGSYVGNAVRKSMYADLEHTLGKGAISLRTVAGDVTSNGTVAESAYVNDEAKIAGKVPTAAVGGDHDSVTTWKQMKDAGIIVPDFKTDEVDGLLVSGANDREHKTLFGGMVTDPTGVTEDQLGQKLRKAVDEDVQKRLGSASSTGSEPAERGRIVLVHQPYAAAGYLGVDSIDDVIKEKHPQRHLTRPYDDGIDNVPPGIVDYGHWHQLGGPWVLWNTSDTGEVTWTMVDQLGTAGGVENAPTFSRFSTPDSAPLKPLSIRLQYVNTTSGLATGYVTVRCDLGAQCRISKRTDVGLPGGMPGRINPPASTNGLP